MPRGCPLVFQGAHREISEKIFHFFPKFVMDDGLYTSGKRVAYLSVEPNTMRLETACEVAKILSIFLFFFDLYSLYCGKLLLALYRLNKKNTNVTNCIAILLSQLTL
jgi:hypothetical protein